MVRVVPDARRFLRKQKTLRQDPRFRERKRADAPEFLHTGLERIHPQAAFGRQPITFKERGIFHAKLRFHAPQKFSWQILLFHKNSITPPPMFGERRFHLFRISQCFNENELC